MKEQMKSILRNYINSYFREHVFVKEFEETKLLETH